MGQSSKAFALPEERLASEEDSEGRRERCATPSTGKMAQNPATAPTHQTRSDEKLRKNSKYIFHLHFRYSILVLWYVNQVPQLKSQFPQQL
jgi:hypothetical protein